MAREASVQEQGVSSSSSSSSVGQDQEQEQLSFYSVAFAAYANFLSMLGVLIQVKAQADNVSLYEEHKAIIYSFVVVITIYLGTIIISIKIGTKVIGPIRLLSGIIAPILLLLILVPVFGWLLLVLCVFLLAKVAWDYLPQVFDQATSSTSPAESETRNSTSAEESSTSAEGSTTTEIVTNDV